MKISETLESLNALRGVNGAVLFDKSGLIKGSALPGGIDPKVVTAIVKLILKASQRATKDLEQGQFSTAIIESAKGKIIVSELAGCILTIITTSEVEEI